MSNSSFLGGESAATRAAGRDADALGPSDSSDSGSDVQGEHAMSTDADNPGELGGLPLDLGSDSDSSGTGERGSATGDGGRDGADILPDRIVDSGTVERDGPIDRDMSGGIDDIADDMVGEDAEDGDGDDDDDASAAQRAAHDAAVAEAVSGSAADTSAEPHGRVFTLPPGTLEAGER